ncbi:MAG: GGDEF domain-containing protein [Gammaproteobacteria bacterium]|nr:MAG: GGDEF domain-containing protein [Gammaproteobacteria bacterium]
MEQNNHKHAVCPVGESHCAFLNELASLRDQLKEMASLVHTDMLTGLYNLRFMLPAIEREMERTRRTGLATGLIMMDLDHFKKVNDQWGHEVGNQALCHAASILRSSVRKIDIPCRYGGEEFAIILPSSDLFAVSQVAERIRSMLARSPLQTDGQSITLTASLGVEMYTSVSVGGAEELVKKADKYLYQAKQSGRNRVCHAVMTTQVASEVNEEEKNALFDIFVGDNSCYGVVPD